MKKLLCFALVAVMALSLVACGSKPAAVENPGDESNPVVENSDVENNSDDQNSGDENDVSVSFPLTYTPKWSTEYVKSEGNPEGTLAYAYGGIAYDPEVEIVLEYCKDEDKLFTALNGKSDWPTELDDVWKGYGYVAIETTDTKSVRTLAVGQYQTKHASVIRQHEEALNNSGFQNAAEINATPKDGSRYVNNCMLVSKSEATIEQIATAAYEALYLQAWNLVPADQQGVQISANGKTYTVSDILKEMAG